MNIQNSNAPKLNGQHQHIKVRKCKKKNDKVEDIEDNNNQSSNTQNNNNINILNHNSLPETTKNYFSTDSDWEIPIYEIIERNNPKTFLCMNVLVLDFPTLSAESIAKYINSRYGPNNNYSSTISTRTVQRYLKKLKFNVKKASFAPPNRNSIGLRIYRVAWCKIIDDILQTENVLIAFTDEASVTTCEGRKYGRAFAAITPVLNIPLSKITMTIVAMVII